MAYLDTRLTPRELTKVLDQHGVIHRTVKGRVKALDSYVEPGVYAPSWGCRFVDVTDWTAPQLAEWLGY